MKRWICLLLSLTLMLGSFALPAQAESSALDALLQTLRKTTPTPEAPAEETPPPAEETDAPAEEQEEADSEADAEEETDQAADSVFEGGYVTVPAGTKAYRTAALSALAGVFTAEGNAYALSASSSALELAFVNAGTRQTTVVYVGRDAVIPLSASEAGSLKVTLALRGAPKYEGFPLPAAAFGAQAAPVQEPAVVEEPVPETADEDEPVQEPAAEEEPVPEVTDIDDKADAAWKAAPTNVKAVLSADGTKAMLSWTGNDACTGYAVYEQLASGYKVLGTVTGADKTTYTTKALEDGEHTFYVKAKNGSQVGYASETVSVTIGGATSTPAPTATPGPNAWKTAPANVTAELSADGTKAVLSWTGNDACTGYAIYEQLASGYKVMGTVTGADKTTYTTKALEDGEHVFYVKPRNGSQVGYASETVSVTVGGATPTPAPTATPNPNDWRTAPTNLTAELSADGTKAVLSWTGNDVCTGYAIYEQLESGYKVMGTVTGADKTTYTTKALEDGEHVFFVTPRKNSAVGYASETVSVTVGGATPTPAPTATPDPDAWKTAPANVSAVLSADYTKAVLTWDANPACTGYAIYEQLADGSYKVMGTVSGADTLTYTTKALAEGSHTLYVKTRNGSKVGTASETVTVTIPAAWKIPPENVQAALSADYTKAVLTWDANPACTGYAIYEQLGDGSYKVLGSVSGADRTTYTTKTLESGQHTLYVKSKNGSQVGYASETVSVTIPSADELWRMAPTDVTAVLSDDPTKAVLSWTGNAYCTGYAVYEQLDSGYKVLGTVTGADTTTFTTKALTPGEHTFYVKPRKNSAVGSASETVSLTIPNIISGTWGNLSWTLDEDGLLTISGTGDMQDFEDTENPQDAWRGYSDQIKSVVIASGVTGIGAYAFEFDYLLTSVSVPSTVTRIGSGAFFRCSALSSVTIPGSVRTIDAWAFSGCAGLTSVTIPAGVTSVHGAAFAGCENLTRFTVASGNSAYTAVNGVLFSKDKTSLAAFPGGKTGAYTIPAGVTRIEPYAFNSCASLNSVTIPEGVTFIGASAFADCYGLTSVTIPSSVNEMGDRAFTACDGLASVIIEEGVPEIGRGAFQYCDSLTSVTIPASVIRIRERAFASCASLDTVHYSGTRAEWDSITVNSGNEPLLNAELICTGGYSGTWGNLSWTLNADGLLTISGSGDMQDFEDFEFTENTPGAWRNYFNQIKSVVIASGITGIGAYAFELANEMTSVSIPSTVTRIGSGAFYRCYALTSVTIPGNVSSIGAWAFGHCRGLTGVTIPAGVTSVHGAAFAGCESLTRFTVASGSSAYTAVNGVLFSKDKTSLAAFPGGKTGAYTIPAGVTRIEPYAFSYCTALNFVTIPEGVTFIGECAFYGCYGLTSVTIPSSVNEMEDGAFMICSFLTSVIIEEGLPEIGSNTFAFCSGLTDITIPDSVTSIGDGAFQYSTSLTTVNYSGTQAEWDSVAIGENNDPLLNAEVICTGTEILPSGAWGNLSWALDADGVLTISGTGAMDNFTYESTDAWLEYRSSIQEAVIQEGVTSIGEYAFQYCDNMTNVTIPDSVTSIGHHAFYYCLNLPSVTIPAGVTSIAYQAFYACIRLNNYIVSSGNSSYSSVNGSLFNKNKTVLISVPRTKSGAYTIPGSVTRIEKSAFSGCESLTGITVPASVTSIGEYAFFECKALMNVTLPDSVTSIGDSAFCYCHSLTDVTLPNSLTGIGNYMFEDCYSLTNVTIPDSVTSIGEGAFYDCWQLTSVTIPASVTNIGDGAFENCTSLTTVYYTGTQAEWDGITIEANNENLLNAEIVFVTALPSGTWGNLSWTLDADGLLTISGSGPMNALDPWSGEAWMEHKYEIRNVVINNGVTSIGANAFSSCTSLETVSVPASVTEVGEQAFVYATSLTAISVASGNTALSFADGVLFNHGKTRIIAACPAAISGQYTVPSGVTDINGHAFQYCYNLTTVCFSQGLKTIGEFAFAHSGINSITLASGVLPRKYTRYYGGKTGVGVCTFSLPYTVTSLGFAAFDGTNLEGIHPDLSVSGDAIPANAYQGCDAVMVDTNWASSIGSKAFANSSQLKYVVIQNSSVSIADDAFSGCSNLVFLLEGSSMTAEDETEWQAVIQYAENHGFTWIMGESAGKG